MGIHIQRTDVLTGSGNPNNNSVLVEYQGQFYMDIDNIDDVKLYYGVIEIDKYGAETTNKWVPLETTYLDATNFHFKVGPIGSSPVDVNMVGGTIVFTFKEDDYVKFGMPMDQDGNIIDGQIMVDSSKLTETLNKLQNSALDITRDKNDENRLLIKKPGQETIELLLWYECVEQEMDDIIDKIPPLDLSNIEVTGNILFNSMTRAEMRTYFNSVFGLEDE